MRIFVTGASGFVGSAVVTELLRAGHRVVGLARSDASAAAVKAAGAEVQRGDLDDVDGLGRGASSADGVIHLGFIHDFANYAKSAETDRLAIQTMAAALAGSNRPLVVASGTLGVGAPGAIATEDDLADATRRFSESALAAAPSGVRGITVRLSPTVHGDGDHGFVPRLIQIAREKGISGFPGDGANRWSAVHFPEECLGSTGTSWRRLSTGMKPPTIFWSTRRFALTRPWRSKLRKNGAGRRRSRRNGMSPGSGLCAGTSVNTTGTRW